MNAKDAIRSAMDMGLHVIHAYVGDLEDAELLQRPAPQANHVAWQLGHLISSEVHLLNSICPGKAAELPSGFAEQHAKENCQNDDRANFCSKQEYLELFQRVRGATLEALQSLPDAGLDAPSPESFREHFPTVGQMFVLIANHPMMHAGQLAVVRRQLDKPVVI
jgi:uncharacterized damage-inducible protein DinB